MVWSLEQVLWGWSSPYPTLIKVHRSPDPDGDNSSHEPCLTNAQFPVSSREATEGRPYPFLTLSHPPPRDPITVLQVYTAGDATHGL
jgi:hypothetical protein